MPPVPRRMGEDEGVGVPEHVRAARAAPRAGRRPVLSTVHGDGRPDDPWTHLVEVHPPTRAAGLLPWLVRLRLASRGRRAVVLRGTVGAAEGWSDLLGAVVLRLTGSRARVVVSDATLEPGSAALARRLPARATTLLEACSVRLVRAASSPRTTWCVLSSEEQRTFAATWGLRRGRVVRTPFCHSVHEPERVVPVDAGPYVFAGGNSLRDYDRLVREWGPDLPPLRVATTRRVDAPVPPGASVDVRPCSPREFLDLMAGAEVVCLPLRPAARSTGQQSYLNAMRLRRPVVVTDAPGVRDHVEEGVTGFVAGPGPGELAAAVRRALATEVGELDALLDRAEAAVERDATPLRYRRRLLEVAGVVSPAGGSPATS